MGSTSQKVANSSAANYATASAPDFPTSKEELQNYALSKIPGGEALKLRMAGDKTNLIDSLTSFAEESTKTKYSPQSPSKDPSGYLGQSARGITTYNAG
jgi:hypothetical protein